MAMNVHITNHLLSVGCLELTGVAAASMLQIGDTDSINLYSIFDTPPEAIIIGPFAPLPAPGGGETETGIIQGAGGQSIVPIQNTTGTVQSAATPGRPASINRNGSIIPASAVNLTL
ncbi:hypothetical protein [Paenibacillus herberti]|uniref:hypothetical protein n=1 Tax=Paenibacillus herberti TaxID=1619309 RepID=UPI0026BB955D